MFRKLLVSLVVMLGLGSSAANAAHPVLHLTIGKQESLQYSYTHNYNDTQIDKLYEWCFLNCESYNAANLQDENYIEAPLSTSLRNFALAYAIYPYAGNSTLYGYKAASLVNDLVMNPPQRFTSLADWMHKTNHYAARNVLYSYACVYDWTYQLMTRQQRYNIRRGLVVAAKRFYVDAHNSTLATLADSAYGSNRPHSNYNYGELLGYMAAVLAVKEDTNAVNYVYTYLRDTMLVENKKALRGGSFIAAYRNEGNLVGRDVGGMHMESTRYSAEDNEMLGCLIDLYFRYADAEVSTLVADYFSKVIMSQIYATYPDRTFDGVSKMFGEGYAGDGTIGDTEAMAMTIAASLCSNPDTAGAAIWWLNNYSTLAPSNPLKLTSMVLFNVADILVVSNLPLAVSSYLSGPQYLFVRSGNELNELDNDMLLTFRGGVGCEPTAQPGFGNITWFKGGFGIADPALLKTDKNQLYINDFYHNTVSVDTCADGYKSWVAKPTGSATLEHSNVNSSYIYYAFDFTTPYTGQKSYVCNTVKHKEREFLYIPNDTLLFLFDRVSTYNTRRDPNSFTAVPYIYPITWSMYTEGEVSAGNTAFLVKPRYGSYKLAGYVATPDTNLYLRSTSDEKLLEVTETTCAVPYTTALRYSPWVPDSVMEIASTLWMNTHATPDSLFRVRVPYGHMFGTAASAYVDDLVWIDYVAMFSTDAEGDTGSVWGTHDSITICYGRPSDSVNVFLLNMSSRVDSFMYKVVAHRADTLILRLRRTKTGGYTRCYSNTAGVVRITSGSTGGVLPPHPPPPPPPTGGKTFRQPRIFDVAPFLVPATFGRRFRKFLKGFAIFAVALCLGAGAAFGQSGMKFDCTNASGTKYFIDINRNNFFASTLWIKLDSDAVGPLTIYRTTLASVQIDSTNAIVLEPGESYSLPVVGARGFAYSKTAATDCMRYLPLAEGEVSYGGSPTTLVLTDNVLLTNSFTIAASGIMSFSKPLVPVGDHTSASFTVKCIGTVPDTTYFQIIAANTSMDTLSVLNIGTIATPVLSGAWPASVFSTAHPWHSTGVEFPLGIDLRTISNAKFIGIRLSPDNSRAGTYYVVCNLK